MPSEPRPDLFVVGAPKCGTTSLHQTLGSHPQIFMSGVKEPHHFADDLRFRHPPNPYLDRGRYLALFRDAGRARRIGESSVWNLFSSVAAERIARFNPGARIICVLRRPADLVISLHAFACRRGVEPLLRLSDALDAEHGRAMGRGIPRSSYAPWSLGYTAVARYEPQLRRYFDAFPRENVAVLVFEELLRDPAGTLADLQRFLEVDPDPSISFARENVTADYPARNHERLLRSVPTARSWLIEHVPGPARAVLKRTMEKWVPSLPATSSATSEDVDRLERSFASDLGTLEALLGRSLDVWRRPRPFGGGSRTMSSV